MKKLITLATVTFFTSPGFAASDNSEPYLEKPIIFGMKMFSDMPDIATIIVSGTVTGNGVGYKNNYTMLACYRERKQCVAFNIEQNGFNQVSSAVAPDWYEIDQWNDKVVIASSDTGCISVTIKLDRILKTATIIQGPNQVALLSNSCRDTTTYKWTIEDGPARRAWK
jgi:hypothetical protein